MGPFYSLSSKLGWKYYAIVYWETSQCCVDWRYYGAPLRCWRGVGKHWMLLQFSRLAGTSDVSNCFIKRLSSAPLPPVVVLLGAVEDLASSPILHIRNYWHGPMLQSGFVSSDQDRDRDHLEAWERQTMIMQHSHLMNMHLTVQGRHISMFISQSTLLAPGRMWNEQRNGDTVV